MNCGDAVDVHGSRDAQVAVFADSRAAITVGKLAALR